LHHHYIPKGSVITLDFRFGPFFVTPIVAGLENGKPILATYDSIGCKSDLDDF
jgi:20S proteasome alpha/beta subunit